MSQETQMALEREVKLEAEAEFVLPDLTGVLPGAVVSVEAPRRLRATYWDTADLRLARAGVTVRHRAGEEGSAPPGDEPPGGGHWTVKLPAGDNRTGDNRPGEDRTSAVMSRREVDFEGASDAVPASVAGLVRAHVRTAALVPVARLTTRRVSLDLRGPTNAPIARVDDDTVTVDEVIGDGDGGRPACFREIEVELGPDASEEVARAVVNRLVRAGATEGNPVPKVLRALGPAALRTPDVGSVAFDRGRQMASGGVLVRGALAAGTSRLVRHDPGVRLGEDPEDVHQARVATRRLRSDLATFSDLVDSAWATHLRSELAWLGDALGRVRDSDVLLDRLRADARLLPEVDYHPAAHVLEVLGADRVEAQVALAQALDSPRYLGLLDALVDAANAPRLTPLAETPAVELAPALVGGTWKRLVSAIDDLGGTPGDDALHQVRIKAKRCRYAAEAVAPVARKPAGRLGRRVADLQTVLGDLHDAVVAEDRLRAMVTSPGTPLTPEDAAVAGALMETQRRRAGDQRRQWHKAWRKASKSKVHSWLR
ncbi:MAG: hypothetical protein DLM54_00935 [Acidimicrobiales bacterium]|nr:MAG: hypothetical protein DLM54_00935 [Acidimicrobiales bacterium]